MSAAATPGFPGIPLHKQALLSPLLAHWHLAAGRHPLFTPGLRPELDLLAEHKALMERFSQAAAAAAAAAANTTPVVSVSPESPVKRETSVSPPASKDDEEPQSGPMDLSSGGNKVKEESKEDVNKNLVDVVSTGDKENEEQVLDLCSKS